MGTAKRMNKSEYGPRTASFLNLAYRDYLAARVLLTANLPLQGAVLASTALEKYFKAILAFRGNEHHGHLSKAHINAARAFHPKLNKLLNDDFLELLQRVYLMRYTEDVPKGFNLVIASREFLAELDFSCVMLQEGFSFQMNGKKATFQYDMDREKSDPRLLFDNCALADTIRRQDFISAEPQLVYEVRDCPIHGLVEIHYVASARRSDRKFTRPGCEPVDAAGFQYRTAFKNAAPHALMQNGPVWDSGVITATVP